jgi:hypothetical protein
MDLSAAEVTTGLTSSRDEDERESIYAVVIVVYSTIARAFQLYASPPRGF